MDSLIARTETVAKRMVDLEGQEETTALHDLLDVQDVLRDLLQEIERLRADNARLIDDNHKMRAAHRWNIERDGNELRICHGEHDKALPCDLVTYVRKES